MAKHVIDPLAKLAEFKARNGDLDRHIEMDLIVHNALQTSKLSTRIYFLTFAMVFIAGATLVVESLQFAQHADDPTIEGLVERVHQLEHRLSVAEMHRAVIDASPTDPESETAPASERPIAPDSST